MATETSGESEIQRGVPDSMAWLVDWLVPVLVVLLGVATIVAGSVVLVGADRDLIETMVADGTIQSEFLTGADLVTVSLRTVEWTGWGLLVTGLALVGAGVLFFVYRRRRAGSFVTSAVVGALVAAVTSFLPFSTVLGGGVAGYLQRGDRSTTVTVGAVSGLLAVTPVLLVVVFVFGGLLTGAFAIGEGSLALVLTSVALFVVLFVAALSAAVGGLGGYVGGRLRNTDGRPIEETTA